MRESAIGPDLSHRRNLIRTMVASDALQEAIAEEAARLGVTAGGGGGSGAQVRVGDRVGLQLSGRARDGARCSSGCGSASTTASRSITANELAKVAPGKGLVYLPNHRSHVDYLLLSYLVHAQGLAPPHIAAGANLNFPIVGPLLRRGGAFFLRRSFKGEPLYAAVFREYLHAMLAKGFPIAYFIEGGRSRSGRTLAPKGGLLGMTVESFMREHPRPLLLVPVHFSYEKLLEGRTLVAELEGQPKEGESLGALVRRRPEPAARVRERARQFRRAAVGRPVPRPGGARLARAARRRAAGRGAAADAAARARDGAAHQRGGRHQSDQPVRDGHRAQPAPCARRARARAADRLAEDDRVPAALLAGRRAHRRRSGGGDRAGAEARLRHARRASARRHHRGSGQGSVRAQLPAQQRAARLCAARAGREPAGRPARGHAGARCRVRRGRAALPARGADAAPLARGGGRGVEAHRRAVRRAGARARRHGRHAARRGSLQPRACRTGAARPFAAAPAAPQLPDDRAADPRRLRHVEAGAPRGADADAHAAAVAAVRVRAAGFLRALDVRVLHRHAARDGPRPRGRRRVAAPARAHPDVGALCRAAAPGGRRARHPARCRRAGAAGGSRPEKEKDRRAVAGCRGRVRDAPVRATRCCATRRPAR